MIAIVALLVFGAWLMFRRRRGVRATERSGATQTWAQASDVRFARYPRGRWFKSRKGLD